MVLMVLMVMLCKSRTAVVYAIESKLMLGRCMRSNKCGKKTDDTKSKLHSFYYSRKTIQSSLRQFQSLWLKDVQCV